jgi:hypothetical protein
VYDGGGDPGQAVVEVVRRVHLAGDDRELLDQGVHLFMLGRVVPGCGDAPFSDGRNVELTDGCLQPSPERRRGSTATLRGARR